MLQTDFQKLFYWFTADLGKLVELGWQKYLETENYLLTTNVQLLGQILVLPPSYWYRWKALEKFALWKWPYFFKILPKKGPQSPRKLISQIFKKITKMRIVKKPIKIFSIFFHFSTVQYHWKNISIFYRYLFLISAPKKGWKSKFGFFRFFWGVQVLLHILGRKFHFLQLGWAPNFSFRSMLTISAFYRS